jgi:hypothetical protein
VLLGCCYHKTEHAQWDPMSEVLQLYLERYSMEATPTNKCTTCIDQGEATEGKGRADSGCGHGEDHRRGGNTVSKYGLRLAAQETKHRYIAAWNINVCTRQK